MAAPADTFYGVGLEMARAYALTAQGYPKATSTTVYEGIEIPAPKGLDISNAKPRYVSHPGNNRIKSRDILPSLDQSSLTIKASRLDHAVNAALQGVKVHTIGESLASNYYTDQQGNEPTVAIMTWQQGKISGVRGYGSYHIPSCVCKLDLASMNDNPNEYTYNIVQSPVNHYIFGLALTANDDGCLEAEINSFFTVGRPHIAAWLGDGTATDFLFHTDRPAVSASKIHKVMVVDASTFVVSDETGTQAATTKVVPTTKPGLGDLVLAWYEY